MKPYSINILNAIVLIVLGNWAYLSSETPSLTALIPVFAGVILLALTPWFRKGNRVVAHIAVVLTLLILIGLFKPLTGALGRSDIAAVVRVSIMMVSSLAAMIVFIMSFINARKSPEKKDRSQ